MSNKDEKKNQWKHGSYVQDRSDQYLTIALLYVMLKQMF